jgi:hypothetical protein
MSKPREHTFSQIQLKREIVMKSSIHYSALNQVFNEARTYNEWSEKPVDEQTVRDLYDLLKWGPTSANCCPARFVWVRSAEGKAKLAAPAMEVNRPKILAAPVTVIIGYDLAFPETMPKLFPARGGGDAPDVPSTGARRSNRDAQWKLTGSISYRCGKGIGPRLWADVRLR